MRRILSEKSLVVVLFVLVFITYVFAQKDSREMEKAYTGINTTATSTFVSLSTPVKDLSSPDSQPR